MVFISQNQRVHVGRRGSRVDFMIAAPVGRVVKIRNVAFVDIGGIGVDFAGQVRDLRVSKNAFFGV